MEGPNKSEQELLKEEFAKVSEELGEVISQRDEIKKRMQEKVDYSSSFPRRMVGERKRIRPF